MNRTFYDIKAKCREGLLQYLEKALSSVPVSVGSEILDVGCGTGTPTLFLAKHLDGNITAIDPDSPSIDYLRKKVRKLGLSQRITIYSTSLFDFKPSGQLFDLIIAEGLLNVVGFQKGLRKLVSLLKKEGTIIIHDEYAHQAEKEAFIKSMDCAITDSFVLDEEIWWKDYYQCIEKELSVISDEKLLKSFKFDFLEIETYRKDPSPFTSIYCVVRRSN